MKAKNLIALSSLALSCLTTTALGQFRQPARVTDILGSAVKDAQDQKVGTVKDLALDLENGRVVEVIVSWGGFLGINSRVAAAIPEDFTMAADGKSLSLAVDKARLQAAPAVDLSQWPQAMQQPRIEEVYNYYGSEPYFLVEDHPAHAPRQAVTQHLGVVCRASDLMNARTDDSHGQMIGKVRNIIVDLPDSRVVEVMIDSGRYLGAGNGSQLSAVPPQAICLSADHSMITLNTTKDELRAAPHFPARAWPTIDRAQATEVYQAYHVTPYFLPLWVRSSGSLPPPSNPPMTENNQNIMGTTQPILSNGQLPSETTPIDTAVRTDLEITGRIQKDIMANSDLAPVAHDISVTTLHGKVTLKGVVATLEQKKLAGNLASQIVPPEDVDNQLDVRETAANTSVNGK